MWRCRPHEACSFASRRSTFSIMRSFMDRARWTATLPVRPLAPSSPRRRRGCCSSRSNCHSEASIALSPDPGGDIVSSATMCLMFAPESRLSSPPHPTAITESASVRALVVEDEPKVADALRRGLESEAYEVVVERTAESANARLNAETFDIILLDLMLPDG